MNKLLYMSLVDWYWIKQRPQHFSELLSKDNEVTYVCIRPWENNVNKVQSHSLSDKNLGKKQFMQNNHMKIIRKRLIPKSKNIKLLKFLNELIMKFSLFVLDKKNKFDTVIVTHPDQCRYLPESFFKNKIFLYDCMDNYLEFSNVDKTGILKNERKLLKYSKYIIVSSENLKNKLIARVPWYADKVSVINNGVDIEKFNVNKIKAENEVDIFNKSSSKKVGYIGTISVWMDIELISSIAKERSDLDFYFIGPVEEGTDISMLKDIKNIYFVATQPYESVPNILNKLDVAMMPFRDTDLVRSVNPVKIYEYLSLAKPVIALRYSETEKFGDLIYTYSTVEQFKDKLEKAVSENHELYKNERIQYANKNTWVSRVFELQEKINH